MEVEREISSPQNDESDVREEMADPDGMDRPDVNVDALKSEIRRQLINQKVLPAARRRVAGTPSAAASTLTRARPGAGERLPHRDEDGVARGWHLRQERQIGGLQRCAVC